MHSQYWVDQLKQAREHYWRFIDRCTAGSTAFRLTPRAEPTPYALCFAVFGLALVEPGQHQTHCFCAQALRDNIRALRKHYSDTPVDKAYRQLLTFTLSALAAIDSLAQDPLEDLVLEQLPEDAFATLQSTGALQGKPQSGNQAMFLAIFALHAQIYLGGEVGHVLDIWVKEHLDHMNRFGFWGVDKGMTHLQFQNGYHQYEIFEYLAIENPCEQAAVAAVMAMSDEEGHFAPFPGGSGCYDYDAVMILTPGGALTNSSARQLLDRCASSILHEQIDGGWAESHRVRPRSIDNLWRTVRRVGSARTRALLQERLRYAVTLQRPKYDRIHTHWSRYSRRWDEANLWDGYFRMLTLARIEVALNPSAAVNWGFIPYPGIGYHPSIKKLAGMNEVLVQSRLG